MKRERRREEFGLQGNVGRIVHKLWVCQEFFGGRTATGVVPDIVGKRKVVRDKVLQCLVDQVDRGNRRIGVFAGQRQILDVGAPLQQHLLRVLLIVRRVVKKEEQ